MKKTLQLLVFIVLITFLYSCGGGSSVKELKLIPVKSGKEFQYINKKGEIVINPQFNNASIFRDGLALVQTTGDKGKWGYITDDGKYAINPQYKEATVFSDGLAWVVSENSAPAAIDKKGEVKFIKDDAESVMVFKEGLAAFSIINDKGDEIWGFVDKSGQVKINPQFDYVSSFSEGKCLIRKAKADEKYSYTYGYIDKSGNIIINYQFDFASDFIKGKAVVAQGEKYGIIGKDGKYIINPQFEAIQIDDDKFLVKQNGKYGWCDKDAKFSINPQFNDARTFNGNKLAAIMSGEKWGFVDRNGKIVINPQFDGAGPFTGNMAIVASGEKIGFINKEGKYVINPQYDEVSRDYIMYLFESSDYNYVQTDYFNTQVITNLISIDAPEGFNFNSTFGDVIDKYDLTESKFNKYSSSHQVISYKKLSKNIDYSFSVMGKAYDKVKKGYYYYYTDYEFNKKNKLNGFTYSFSVYGKEDVVFKVIESLLSQYTKDEYTSTKDMVFYTSSTKEIMLEKKSYGTVVLSIYKNDYIVYDEDYY